MNSEADALTNEKFQGFSPSLRIEAKWSDIKPRLSLLMQLLEVLSDYSAVVTKTKASKTPVHNGAWAVGGKKKRKLDKTAWE